MPLVEALRRHIPRVIGDDHVEANRIFLISCDREFDGRHLGLHIPGLIMHIAQHLGCDFHRIARQCPFGHHGVELVVGERERAVGSHIDIVGFLVLHGCGIEAHFIGHLVGTRDRACGSIPGEGDRLLVGNALIEHDRFGGTPDMHLVGIRVKFEELRVFVA